MSEKELNEINKDKRQYSCEFLCNVHALDMKNRLDVQGHRMSRVKYAKCAVGPHISIAHLCSFHHILHVHRTLVKQLSLEDIGEHVAEMSVVLYNLQKHTC